MRNPINKLKFRQMMLVVPMIIVASSSAYLAAYGEQGSVLAEQTNKDRAEKLRKEGHYAEAAGVYKELVKAQPDDAANCFNLGSCYQELHDYGKARTYYEKAAALKPDEKSYGVAVHNLKSIKAAPLVQRGIEKQMRGDYAGAISAYRAALRIDDEPGVHANLAKALTALGKKDQAEAELQKAGK
jgi:tetratricopeptide (TPR) repeat protein